jgi:D-arabinose 1-dehydrogenase-like Zn-dependent alcohol dehydrogenase
MTAHSDLTLKESIMKKGEKLVVIGQGGVGGPAAMLAKKLMPEVEVTIVGEEDRFIVR